jgi:hypothetical protein
MDEMRTVHDPYEGRDVQISDRLVDRLRGQYACGPHLPNGKPEFGWRQFQAPPIQHEAAKRIEELEAALRHAVEIAEDKIVGGTWDDLLKYRKLLSK